MTAELFDDEFLTDEELAWEEEEESALDGYEYDDDPLPEELYVNPDDLTSWLEVEADDGLQNH